MSEYWHGKTVLVTGGLGFIGSHFVETLDALGAEVICTYRKPTEAPSWVPLSGRIRLKQVDLLDQDELRALCKYAADKIDAIIHCAALDGNASFKAEHVADILDVNVRMTSNILNVARDQSIRDVILLSSTEIYEGSTGPFSEADDYHSRPGYSENGYALSKVFSEVMADLYRKQFGMRIFAARPTNVYGPRDGGGRVIPAMLSRLEADEDIEIWGDGSQSRSFIYVKDLVAAVLLQAADGQHNALNIATRETITISQLAQALVQSYGSGGAVRLLLDKPTGAHGRQLNVDRLYSILDFQPRSFENGLTETVEWFKNRKTAQPVSQAARVG